MDSGLCLSVSVSLYLTLSPSLHLIQNHETGSLYHPPTETQADLLINQTTVLQSSSTLNE